jgi:hypothetical protein
MPLDVIEEERFIGGLLALVETLDWVLLLWDWNPRGNPWYASEAGGHQLVP